ncbi:MAG TPA: sialidase family protein, partial [Candidatus Limnocylindrales bacterium]|nr:sialidase family protein [Candidatus Limnocylindrales bacterium]
TPPVLGIDWGRVASVERPHVYEETVAPSYAGVHPILRIAGQAMMTDLVARRGGGFAAMGYVPPDWHPTAWTSDDGAAWTLRPIEDTAFTFPVALARGADGTLVAVGRSGPKPVAWTTPDGVAWTRHEVPALGTDGTAERMTSITAGPNGFVAGGSVGPELFDRQARFWTSPDGATWTPAPDDDAAFRDAEVRSVTVLHNGGFAAAGVAGSVQDPTGSVAWLSPDGSAWTRVDDPAFVGGIAVSLIERPSGTLVAVGSDLDRRNAVAWSSTDGGASWTTAPDEPSRQHSGGYAWMTDVTIAGDALVAVGDLQGLQRGTAMAWTSKDAMHWKQARTAPVQEGAEFYAVIPGGPGVLVVGAFGAPDSYVPDVWQSPAR